MVKAWVADISSLLEKECYEACYETLPACRKKKADAIASELTEKKAQSVGAWVLWSQMKKEYKLSEQAVFNLSHSGSYVMCAAVLDKHPVCMEREREETAPVHVGCDIERIGVFREPLAKRFFCEREYESIMAFATETGRTDAFYRYWVLKESFLKATREGMKLPLDSFEIQLGDPSVLVKQPQKYPRPYYYREYEIKNVSYKMAVCSTDPEIGAIVETELKI